MKKILITVAILFCFFTIKAQTITIKCTFGSDCFTPNPEEFITYSFDVTAGWSASNITWNAPGSSDRGTNGGSSFQVIWPNNTAAKSISVSATLTNGSTSTTKSNTRTVTVKQISTIASMTVTGTGVSGTFSDNGTVNVPCGTRTLNISVPTPTTSPSSGVTYTWTLPSGWSGSSNTNSINATANAGANDGLIRVQYKRTDGNFSQAFNLNVNRPRVTTPTLSFTSGSLTCIGTSATLSASATNATNYTWSSTGNVSVSPTSGATTTATVTGNGNATITVTADNACQSPKSTTSNRAVGTPTFYSITPPNSFNYINGNTILSVQADQPCPAYYWRIFGGSGYINPTSGACSYTYSGTTYNKTNTCYVSTSDFVRVELSSANACGAGQTHTFYLQNGGGYRMTSPNPATSTVSLEFTSEFSAENLKSVALIRDGDLRTARDFNPEDNRQDAAFRSSQAISFDVANLPKGKYYLHIVYKEGKKFSEILILQ